MKVTPNVICGEFIGAGVRIAKNTNQECIGLSGTVIDETRNTFALLNNGKRRVISKHSSTFHFKFPDGTIVEIDGKLLLGRPEHRLKKTIRRFW